ncbi:cell surface protein [Caulobacter sp. LjRoot300]|uniref:cell surface protein n=1 Tax=Caulobacter sp. LjRoot300 TaxID=3342321 RepID=UPI003ECF72DC
MRSIALIAVAGLAAVSLAACSDKHATQIKEGAKAAGSEIKQAATDIKNDPDVKQAGTALKESTEEAAADAKVAAGQAVDKAQEAGAKAGQETKETAADLNADAKKAGSNAKKEVHEATR